MNLVHDDWLSMGDIALDDTFVYFAAGDGRRLMRVCR